MKSTPPAGAFASAFSRVWPVHSRMIQDYVGASAGAQDGPVCSEAGGSRIEPSALRIFHVRDMTVTICVLKTKLDALAGIAYDKLLSRRPN